MTTTVDRVRELVDAPRRRRSTSICTTSTWPAACSRCSSTGPAAPTSTPSAACTRTISRALDEHDPIDGRYALEVGSPGLERPLRTPAHYAGAVGTTVKVKTTPGVEGERRVEGTITAADDDGITVTTVDERASHDPRPTRLRRHRASAHRLPGSRR